MTIRLRVPGAPGAFLVPTIVLTILILGSAPQAAAQAWLTHGHDAQHSGRSGYSSQDPLQVRWSTPVDLSPQYNGNGSLLTHFGAPLITSQNVVVVAVKLKPFGDFRVEARRGTNGSLIWRQSSDFAFIYSFGWTPPFGPTLLPNDVGVVFPAIGGTVLSRATPNGEHGDLDRLAFYGISNYSRNPGAFNTAIQICTPITADASGNIFFGYLSNGESLPGHPDGIPSGLARIGADGVGSFVAASSLAENSGYGRVAMNCAPAVSADGSTVYVAVNRNYTSDGYLCRANATDLKPLGRVRLIDPNTGSAASINGHGTSSPTIGPDGDVYFGVLESNFPAHHGRGWMLHFDASLAQSKTPGSFGWDDTASIVPASAVPSYVGGSSYLILTKYNNYSNRGIGGDGMNRVAVLDPNGQTQSDRFLSNVAVMKEVLTIVSPTPHPQGLPGRTEWCINACAIDAANHCALVNNEDGKFYRWNFDTNTLSEGVRVARPTGEAYTSTAVGPDGAVYCINNAVLSCCVESTSSSPDPVDEEEVPTDPAPAEEEEEAEVGADRSLDHNGKKQGPALGRSRLRQVGPN